MERIASFCVDHTRLDRGMYLSRQDGDVLTWDIRMKKPNHGDYLSTGSAHTLEHLFATYARNSQYKDGVIYVGPMGCRTGFYLLTRGLTPAEALSLTVESFRFMAAFEGDASVVTAGKSRLRPVLMTTLTTVLGMIPMAVGTGEGSEMWRSMGMTVAWGLSVSTLITLIIVPTVYAVFAANGVKRRRRKIRKALRNN